MAHVVLLHKRRNDEVGYTEAKLRRKAELRSSISRVRAWILAAQVAVVGVIAGHCRQARQVAIRIYRDRADVALYSCQRCAGELVGVSGHRRHVIVWPTGFVEAEEEHRIGPRWAVHQRVHDLRHRLLTGEDGLTGAGMLVAGAEVRLDVGKLRQLAAGGI